jgi:hypothetical protein
MIPFVVEGIEWIGNKEMAGRKQIGQEQGQMM